MYASQRVRVRRGEQETYRRNIRGSVRYSMAQATWRAVKTNDPLSEPCTTRRNPSIQSARYKVGKIPFLRTVIAIFFFCAAMESSLTLAAALSRGIIGFDISNYQQTIDFTSAYNAGSQFVIIKATEGSDFVDSVFEEHFAKATAAGLIRGAYHFALPSTSSGALQAEHFIQNGGEWVNDGITLPGMLDLEYNHNAEKDGTDVCYGLSSSEMIFWIQDFVTTYSRQSRRMPMIYTTADWWKKCTDNSTAFAERTSLVLARYDTVVGRTPGGWPYITIWQYNDQFPFGGCSDVFNGNYRQLKILARGTDYA